jgi:hypothetical protein
MGSWLLALLIQLAFSDYSGQTYYKIAAWGDRDQLHGSKRSNPINSYLIKNADSVKLITNDIQIELDKKAF